MRKASSGLLVGLAVILSAGGCESPDSRSTYWLDAEVALTKLGRPRLVLRVPVENIDQFLNEHYYDEPLELALQLEGRALTKAQVAAPGSCTVGAICLPGFLFGSDPTVGEAVVELADMRVSRSIERTAWNNTRTRYTVRVTLEERESGPRVSSIEIIAAEDGYAIIR